MGLLDGLEKLINEHGSATILKERIELANDKYETLLDKNKVLEQKISQLEAENVALRLGYENAIIEIESLKAMVKGSGGGNLDKIKESVLAFLSENEEVSADQIGTALNQNIQVITFHLDELEDSEFIRTTLIMNRPKLWSIAHEGRKYLINHGLLK